MRALEDGRLRWYALAGAAAGLAIAFKYTAGLVLLPLGVAALARLRPRSRPRRGSGSRSARAWPRLVFVALNPYALIDFGEFRDDVFDQAEVAADDEKPGQGGSGFSYYLDSLTWGLRLAGGAGGARRRGDRAAAPRPARGLLLLSMPVALFLYLGLQSRYFGRWMLPAYPVLCMLAAVALVQAVGARPAAGGAHRRARRA